MDDNNELLTCEDYYRDGYTLEAFLATYNPDLLGDVGWTPTLYGRVHPARGLQRVIVAGAGPLP